MAQRKLGIEKTEVTPSVSTIKQTKLGMEASAKPAPIKEKLTASARPERLEETVTIADDDPRLLKAAKIIKQNIKSLEDTLSLSDEQLMPIVAQGKFLEETNINEDLLDPTFVQKLSASKADIAKYRDGLKNNINNLKNQIEIAKANIIKQERVAKEGYTEAEKVQMELDKINTSIMPHGQAKMFKEIKSSKEHPYARYLDVAFDPNKKVTVGLFMDNPYGGQPFDAGQVEMSAADALAANQIYEAGMDTVSNYIKANPVSKEKWNNMSELNKLQWLNKFQEAHYQTIAGRGKVGGSSGMQVEGGGAGGRNMFQYFSPSGEVSSGIDSAGQVLEHGATGLASLSPQAQQIAKTVGYGNLSGSEVSSVLALRQTQPKLAGESLAKAAYTESKKNPDYFNLALKLGNKEAQEQAVNERTKAIEELKKTIAKLGYKPDEEGMMLFVDKSSPEDLKKNLPLAIKIENGEVIIDGKVLTWADIVKDDTYINRYTGFVTDKGKNLLGKDNGFVGRVFNTMVGEPSDVTAPGLAMGIKKADNSIAYVFRQPYSVDPLGRLMVWDTLVKGTSLNTVMWDQDKPYYGTNYDKASDYQKQYGEEAAWNAIKESVDTMGNAKGGNKLGLSGHVLNGVMGDYITPQTGLLTWTEFTNKYPDLGLKYTPEILKSDALKSVGDIYTKIRELEVLKNQGMVLEGEDKVLIDLATKYRLPSGEIDYKTVFAKYKPIEVFESQIGKEMPVIEPTKEELEKGLRGKLKKIGESEEVVGIEELQPLQTSGLTFDIFGEEAAAKIIQEKSMKKGKAEDVGGPDELRGQEVVYYEASTLPDTGSGKPKIPVLMKYAIVKGENGTVAGMWYKEGEKSWSQGNYSFKPDTKEVSQIMCSGAYCGNMAKDLKEGIRYILKENWDISAVTKPTPKIDEGSKGIEGKEPVIIKTEESPYKKPKDNAEFSEWKKEYTDNVTTGKIKVEDNTIFAGKDNLDNIRVIAVDTYNKFNTELKKVFDTGGIFAVWEANQKASKDLQPYSIVSESRTKPSGDWGLWSYADIDTKTQKVTYNIEKYAIEQRNKGKSYSEIKNVLVGANFPDDAVSKALNLIPDDRYASDSQLKSMTPEQRMDYLLTHDDDIRFMSKGVLLPATSLSKPIIDEVKKNNLTAKEAVFRFGDISLPTYQYAVKYRDINSDSKLNAGQKQRELGKVLSGEQAEGFEEIRSAIVPLWDANKIPPIANAVMALAVPSPNQAIKFNVAVNALVLGKDSSEYKGVTKENVKSYNTATKVLEESGTPDQFYDVVDKFYNWKKDISKKIGVGVDVVEFSKQIDEATAGAISEIWGMAKTIGGVMPITLLKMGENMSIGEMNEVAADAAMLTGGMVMFPIIKTTEELGYIGEGQIGRAIGSTGGLVISMVLPPSHMAKTMAKGVVRTGDLVFRKGELVIPNALRQGDSGLAFLNVPKSYYKLIDEINGIVADESTVKRIYAIKDPIQQEQHFRSLLTAESREVWDAGKQLVEKAWENGEVPKTWYADKLDFSIVRGIPVEASESLRAVFQRNKNNGYIKGSFADVAQIQNKTLKALIGDQYGRVGDIDYVVTGRVKAREVANEMAKAINDAMGKDVARVSGTENNAKVFVGSSGGKGGNIQVHTEGGVGQPKPFGWENRFTFVEVDGVKMANFKDQLLRRGDIMLYPAYDEMAGTFGLSSETAIVGAEIGEAARRGLKDWFRLKYQVDLIIDNLKQQGKVDIAEQLQNNLDVFEGGIKKTYKDGGTKVAVELDTKEVTLTPQAKQELLEVVNVLQEVAVVEGKDAYFMTPNGTIIRWASPSEKILQDVLYHVTDDIRPYQRLTAEGKALTPGYILNENGALIPAEASQLFLSPQAALAYLDATKSKNGGIVAIRASAIDRQKYLNPAFRTEPMKEAGIVSFDVFGKKINIGKEKVVDKIFDEWVWGQKPSTEGVKLSELIPDDMKILSNKIEKGQATTEDIAQTFRDYYKKEVGREITPEELKTNVDGFISAELKDNYSVLSDGRIISISTESRAIPLGQKYAVRNEFDKYPMVWFAMDDAVKQGLGIPDINTIKAINNLAMKQAIMNLLYPKLNKSIQVVFDPMAMGRGGSPLEFGKESWQYKALTTDELGNLIKVEKSKFESNAISKLNDELKVLLDKGGDVVSEFKKISDNAANSGSNIIRQQVENRAKVLHSLAKSQLEKTISELDNIITQNKGIGIDSKLAEIQLSLKSQLDVIKGGTEVSVKDVVDILKNTQEKVIAIKAEQLKDIARQSVDNINSVIDKNILKFDDIKNIGDQSIYVFPEKVGELIDILDYYTLIENNKRGTILNQIRQGLTEESRQVWDAHFQLVESLYRESRKVPVTISPVVNLRDVFTGRFTTGTESKIKGVLQKYKDEYYLGGSYADYLQMTGMKMPDFMKPKDIDVHFWKDSKVNPHEIGREILDSLLDEGDAGASKLYKDGTKATIVESPDGDLRFSMAEFPDKTVEIIDYRFNPDGDILFDISTDALFDRNEMLIPDWKGQKRFTRVEGIAITDLRNQILDRGTILLMPMPKIIRYSEGAVEILDTSGTFGRATKTATEGELSAIKYGRKLKDWNRFEYQANYFIDEIAKTDKVLAKGLRDRLEISKEGVKATIAEGGTKGGLLNELGDFLRGLDRNEKGYVELPKLLYDDVRKSKSKVVEDYLINLADLSRIYYTQLQGLPTSSIANAVTVIPEAKTVAGIKSSLLTTTQLSATPTIIASSSIPSAIPVSVPLTGTTPITTPTTTPVTSITTPTTPITTPVTTPVTTTTTTTGVATTPQAPPKKTTVEGGKRTWEGLTPEERLASIVWKQGFANWAISPPYSQDDLIYSSKPFAGTKVHSGPLAAYKSVAKVKGDLLPEKIQINLGTQDLEFIKDRYGKDVIVRYKLDPAYVGARKGYTKDKTRKSRKSEPSISTMEG